VSKNPPQQRFDRKGGWEDAGVERVPDFSGNAPTESSSCAHVAANRREGAASWLKWRSLGR